MVKSLWEKLRRHGAVHYALLTVSCGVIFFAFWRRFIGEAGVLGFALDDAWIHLTLGRNLVNGAGFSINPNEWLPVSTSPVWTLMVALLQAVFAQPVLPILIACFLLTLASALLIYRLMAVFSESPLPGLFAAGYVVCDPLTIWGWGSGMEVALTLFILSAVFYFYYAYDPLSKERRYVLPVCLALAVMVRPELLVLAPLAVADTMHIVWKRRDFRAAGTTAAVQSVILLAALAPYFLFDYLTIGHLLPTTFYAKVQVRHVGLTTALLSGDWQTLSHAFIDNPVNQLHLVAKSLLSHNFFGFLLIPLGLAAFLPALRKKELSRGLLLPLITGLIAPARAFSNTSGRYFVIYLPLASICVGLALSMILETGKSRIAAVLCALCIAAGWPQALAKGTHYVALDVRATNKLYVEMAEWLRDNVEKDAVLAVNDIGAVGYFSQHKIIDLMGLASPEIWPIINRKDNHTIDVERLKEFLRQRGVSYLVASPKYYRRLLSDRSTFQPVAKFQINQTRGREISPQVVYRCNWNAGSNAHSA